MASEMPKQALSAQAKNVEIRITESNGRCFNEIIIDREDAESFLCTGVFMGELAYEFEVTGGFARNEVGRARIIGEPAELCALAQKVLKCKYPVYLAVRI